MEAELFSADRRTDMKLIVAFRNFANASKKQDAWEKLAKEMNKPVDECKKMQNLLSTMRREKIKMKKNCDKGKVNYF